VKIILEPSATRNAMFKAVRSNTTPPNITPLRSNLVEFHHVTVDTLQMFKFKGQREVMYQQQKRHNTAMNRFSDFELDMAS